MPRVLLVTSGRERFGLAVKDVREVVKEPLLHDVPLAPPELLGVINVHDTVVPVIDFARLCGTAGEAGRQMVILDSPCMALAVTAVHGLCSPPLRMPGGLKYPWVREVCISPRGVAGLIDVALLQQRLRTTACTTTDFLPDRVGG